VNRIRVAVSQEYVNTYSTPRHARPEDTLPEGGRERDAAWPLHEIATTNTVWCLAYEKGGGGGGRM